MRRWHPERVPVDDADAEKAGAALAALGGVVLVFLSWQPLNRLFAPDRDNHFVIYLVLGLPLLVPGLCLLAYAVKTWRNAGRQDE